MAKGKYEEWLRPDNLTILQGWARNGLTDEQIAKNMGINVATLYRWKNNHCEICEALKASKEKADLIVENALYNAAIGQVVSLKKRKRIFNRKTNTYEMVVVEETDQYVPPSTTAQRYWLNNRKYADWREKREYEESDPEALSKARELLGDIPSVIE